MSETPEVEAIGTLYQRGKLWRWKVKVPSELGRLPQYLNDLGETKQNATDVNLKTEDKTEARAKALALAAEWSSRFTAELRALEVQSPHSTSPALVEAIAQRIRAAALAEDERLAEELECDLVYALVPRRPLSEMVEDKTKAIAREEVLCVAHTMDLENQRPSNEFLEKEIERRAAELLRGRWSNLWR